MQTPLLSRDWLDCDIAHVARLAPFQPVHFSGFEHSGLKVTVKREDLLHPLYGGNKIYKLYHHLKAARAFREREAFDDTTTITATLFDNTETYAVASFGGAYSNHLLALAAACEQMQWPCICFVRGDAHQPLSDTLQDVTAMGAKLIFLSRQDYRRRHDAEWLACLANQFSETLCWIPEGGGGVTGARGVQALGNACVDQNEHHFDAVIHACGTGASLAGLCCGIAGRAAVWGVPVLKGQAYLEGLQRDITAIQRQLGSNASIMPPKLLLDCHCGGYAKFPTYLREFLGVFEEETGLLLDPVYTAKIFWGLLQKVNRGEFPNDFHVLVIHSGGLQGRRGFFDE